MSIFDPPLDPQEVIDSFQEYDIIEFVDSGGEGEIWKVRDGQGETIALKLYPLTSCMPVRVEREIKALSTLDSDFVVTLLDHGKREVRDIDCLYYCSNFLDGRNLKRDISNGNILNPDEVANLIIEVGRAIEAIWEHRIVHRDIKPANILHDGNNFVVIDLGCARHLDETTLTASGQTLGTLGYLSPEQMRARKGLTLRSDFFALGIVAYEAATGIHPFSKRQDLIAKIDPEPIQEQVQMPGEHAKCIHSLLKKNIIDRPNSVEEIISILGN